MYLKPLSKERNEYSICTSEYTYDKEAGTQQCSLTLDVQIHRERNAYREKHMISALQKHMISNDSLICKKLSVAVKKRTSHTKIICTQKSTGSIIHKEYNEHI